MPANNRNDRFADATRGQAIGAGLQSSTNLPDTFTGKDTRRNLKEFKKFGMPQKLSTFARKTDTQIENLAANAIIRKHLKSGDVTRKKYTTNINFKRFKRKEIRRARRVMNADSPKMRARKNTRAARLHIRRIRANRKIMSVPLFHQNV